MSQPTSRAPLWIGLALAALMLATRGQHLLSLSHPLPDASLAIFFLAGFYLSAAWAFPALLTGAVLIDFAAVTWGGVSSFCISPAYWLLIPAYGLMWGAGRWNGNRYRAGQGTWGSLGVSLLGAALMAELLASGGFYLFSGRFADPNLAELAGRLLTYLPTTLVALLLYLGAAALIQGAVGRAAFWTDRRGLGAS